ncbi:MAG TPA: hypothetical protein VKB62_07210, partial [Streptosporangiaceae bacterium]|nr:hypothetical protein [Streptosporangiaceae bacterium]
AVGGPGRGDQPRLRLAEATEPGPARSAVAYQTWRISRGELAPTDAQEIAAIAGTRRVDPPSATG